MSCIPPSAQLITEKTYLRLDINENYGLSIIDRHKRSVPERSAGAEQIVALALIDGLNKTQIEALLLAETELLHYGIIEID